MDSDVDKECVDKDIHHGLTPVSIGRMERETSYSKKQESQVWQGLRPARPIHIMSLARRIDEGE